MTFHRGDAVIIEDGPNRKTIGFVTSQSESGQIVYVDTSANHARPNIRVCGVSEVELAYPEES